MPMLNHRLAFGPLAVTIVIACAILTIAPAAAAQTVFLHVDNDADLGGDGEDWPTAFRHLQDAILEVHANPQTTYVIQVAQGTYYADLSENDLTIVAGDRSESFTITRNNLTIKGGYAGIGASDPNANNRTLYPTRLSGDLDGDDEPDFVNRTDNSYHVIKTSGLTSTAIFDGLIISGGYVTTGDGLPNLTATLCPNIINGITGASGGGMQNIGSSPRIMWCVFEDNFSHAGGGMANVIGSSPIVANCVFQDNHSTNNGGGIFDRCYSSPTVVNCKFLRNSCVHTGGGFHVRDADIETPPADQVFIINCLFVENSADDFGGGLRIGYDADATIANCTFINNYAGDGGGIAAGRDTSGATGDVIVTNCVLWGNTCEEIVGVGPQVALIGGNPVNVTIAYSDIQDRLTGGVHDGFDTLTWGAGNMDAYPELDQNHRPQSGSPLINAGFNSAVPADSADLDNDSDDDEATPIDLAEYERFCNQQTVDIGAFEFQGGTTCLGDIAPPEGNGVVGVPDLLAIINGWGDCPAVPSICDGDIAGGCGDRSVGVPDLLAVINSWGNCSGGGGTSMPESLSDCWNDVCDGLTGEDWQKCMDACVQSVCERVPSQCE